MSFSPPISLAKVQLQYPNQSVSHTHHGGNRNWKSLFRRQNDNICANFTQIKKFKNNL